MKPIKGIYIKDYHGFQNLYVHVQYQRPTDDEESKLIIDKVFIRRQFSMGVGHSEDITSLFKKHESVNEELTETLIKMLDKDELESKHTTW